MSWAKARVKAIAAFVGFAAAGTVGVAGGGIHGLAQWTIVAVALANAVQIYVTPNLTGGIGKWAKEVSAFVIALGTAVPVATAGGLDGQGKVMLGSMVLGAFGAVLPNVGNPPTRALTPVPTPAPGPAPVSLPK